MRPAATARTGCPSSPRWRRRRSRRRSGDRRRAPRPGRGRAPRGPARRSGRRAGAPQPARPSTSRRGCTRAQCGVKVAPRAPATSSRSRVAAASSQTVPSSHAAECAAATRARASCAGVRATTSAPPLTKPAPRPSSASTRPTSSTVSRRAASWARVGGAAVPPVERVGPDRPERRHPAAVAAARAEADVLGLEHEHLAPGLVTQQVVGGPQPGVATADDDHVRGLGQRLGGGRSGGARRHPASWSARETTGPPWGSPTTAARSTAPGVTPAIVRGGSRPR